MKNFILKIGESLIRIVVILGVIVSIVYAYLMASVPLIGGGNIIVFLILSIFGISAVVLGAFLIYLLIDIRDQLRFINEKLSK